MGYCKLNKMPKYTFLNILDNRSGKKVKHCLARTARIIGVHENTIRYWIKQKKLPETYRNWTVSIPSKKVYPTKIIKNQSK